MNAREQFQAASDLFLEASGLPADQINEYLDRKCGSDHELRTLVLQFLATRDRPGAFETLAERLQPVHLDLREHLPDPSSAAGAVTRPAGGHERYEEEPNEVVGRYRLIKRLGEGGFGHVWVAEQREPVQRHVALKLIKAGMDSREVLARFETERQALAVMDHPNIAKVFDAGMTERGRPYFVMEQVPGQSITNFCDARKLRLRERLALFIPVCEAIHHAHQKGLIHRDLKPSNILVTMIDGRPMPKVIDFGIAKATSSPTADRTAYTEAGRLMGTPEYMSPEQAAGAIDVDTRSDLYSLGVVLYQLLTGTLPLDGRMLRAAGHAGIVKLIREQDPPRPSTRLQEGTKARRHAGTKGDDSGGASLRASVPSCLRASSVRGDLDWVVMKCLEKDRARRYQSASELTTDLQRFLADEPVLAAPPSGVYRFRKFVRRNSVAVVAATAVVLALLLGAAGSAWQAHRAGIERDVAIKAQRSETEQRKLAEDQKGVAEAQRNRAVAAEAETKQRADELLKVSDFQATMLTQIDPSAAGIKLSEDVRARFESALAQAGMKDDAQRATLVESFVDLWGRVNATDAARELIDQTILRPAVAAIDKQFSDQPAIAASLHDALAERYYSLGLYDAALPLQQQALAERRRAFGEQHPDTLRSLSNIGVYLHGIGKADEAAPYYFEALETRRRVLGNEHEDTLTSISNVGDFLQKQGKLAQAEPYLREALETRRRVLGEEHPDTLRSISNTGVLLSDQGRFADAEPYYRDALEKRRRVLGEDHPVTLLSLNNLAALLNDLGRNDEAIIAMREGLEKRRRVLGESHPNTLRSMANLGTMLAHNGRPDEGAALMREGLAAEQRLLGRNHPGALISLSNLAVFLIGQGMLAEAEPMCREALERRRQVLGAEHSDTLISYNVMGFLLRRQNKPAEAEPYAREALSISRRVLGPEHPDTFLYTHNLAATLREQGQLSEAEPLFRDVVVSGGSALGNGHALVLRATGSLGAMLVEQQRYADAAELLTAAEPAAREAYTGSSQRTLATFLMTLGKARSGLGKFADAEARLVEAHGIFASSPAAAHADTRACVQSLADLNTAWNTAAPGAGHDAKAAEWRKLLEATAPTGD